jgi:hypothetical protein
MIERVRLFSEEYERRIRSVDITHAPPISTLKHAISFAEVRSLDLLCKDALQRRLPEYPDLANKWQVYGMTGIDSPDEVHPNLAFKRTIVQHALSLIGASEPEAGLISFLPRDYSKLTETVSVFFGDSKNACENYEQNVFIMARFQPGNETLECIDRCIRNTLHKHGLVGHRADDRVYSKDRNLWDNVCTYMFCCKYGIAILENILVDEFNPNVALEYGFMRGLGKPTLLLKEIRFKPRADILGTIWGEFDFLKIEDTISASIEKWLGDLGI